MVNDKPNKCNLAQTSPDIPLNLPKKNTALLNTTAGGTITFEMDMNNSPSSPDVFSWSTLSSILDRKLHDVARKSDLMAMQTEISNLRAENAKLNEEVKTLKERFDQMDRCLRRNRLIVRGLTCTNAAAASTEFVKVCSELLKTEVKVIDAVMISTKNTYAFTVESSAQFLNILSQRKNLKGTAVFIDQDLTPKERNERYNLRMLSRQLDSAENVKVRLGGAYIYINDKKFFWGENCIVAASDEDADALTKILRAAKLQHNIIVNGKHNQLHQTVSAANRTGAKKKKSQNQAAASNM